MLALVLARAAPNATVCRPSNRAARAPRYKLVGGVRSLLVLIGFHGRKERPWGKNGKSDRRRSHSTKTRVVLRRTYRRRADTKLAPLAGETGPRGPMISGSKSGRRLRVFASQLTLASPFPPMVILATNRQPSPGVTLYRFTQPEG